MRGRLWQTPHTFRIPAMTPAQSDRRATLRTVLIFCAMGIEKSDDDVAQDEIAAQRFPTVGDPYERLRTTPGADRTPVVDGTPSSSESGRTVGGCPAGQSSAITIGENNANVPPRRSMVADHRRSYCRGRLVDLFGIALYGVTEGVRKQRYVYGSMMYWRRRRSGLSCGRRACRQLCPKPLCPPVSRCTPYSSVTA
jgi:hypothetical protein